MTTSWLHQTLLWMHEIQASGWIGWLFFVGLFAFSCLILMPGSILTLGAGTIYGFWGGVLLVQVGNGLGAILSLLITRYLLREWVQKYIKQHPKVAAFQTAVESDGWRFVCLSHLSPIMPFSLINYALGLTRITWWEFLWATEIGSLPATCIYVYLGRVLGSLAKIGSEMRHPGPLEWLLEGVGLIATVIVTISLSRAATKAFEKHLRRPMP